MLWLENLSRKSIWKDSTSPADVCVFLGLTAEILLSVIQSFLLSNLRFYIYYYCIVFTMEVCETSILFFHKDFISVPPTAPAFLDLSLKVHRNRS